jgi:hypothetical protein
MINRCLLVLLFVVPLFAQDPKDVVAWIGTTERVLPASGASAVNIPITLAVALTANPQVRQVTLLGDEIDARAVSATWTGTALARTLTLTVDAAMTKRIGTYTAALFIDTPDAAKFIARTLEVKLVRRGATLSVPTPLRAERVTYIGSYATWTPQSWVVSETTGREGFTPTAKRWAVTLKKAETAPDGSLLYLDLLPIPPKSPQPAPGPKGAAASKPLAPAPIIAAGGQALLKPADSGDCLPFGTTSGKFTLQESQLNAPMEISVEVISRLWRGWLFIIIIVFIALGHFVRKVLEDRRSLAKAALAVDAIRKDFEALATAVAGDPELTQRVITEKARVTNAMKTEDAAAITAAATAASTAITAIRADYEKARKDAKDLVQKLRGIVGDSSALSGAMHTVATDVESQLDTIDARIAAGRASGMLAEAQAVEQSALQGVRRELTQWQAALTELLHETTKWADIDTDTLSQLSARVEALKSDTIDDAGSVFSTAAFADANVQAQAPRFVSEVARIVTLVKEGLGNQSLQPPADSLAEWMADDPHAAAMQLQGLRESVKRALRDEVPQGKPAPVSIQQSKFEEALDEVLALKPPPEEALGEEPEGEGQPAAAAPMMRAEAAASIDAVEAGAEFSAEIEVNGEQIVGETLQLTFHVTRNGAPVPHLVVQWWNGATYVDDGATLNYTLLSTASVVLTAKTTIGGRQISRTVRISAAPDFLFDPDSLRDAIKGVNWIQTAIAGTFITVIGYLMFEKAFVGTLVDLVAPALWGFATDITLAKVLEYAQPLTQRKPGL